jgi:hypothetical protein
MKCAVSFWHCRKVASAAERDGRWQVSSLHQDWQDEAFTSCVIINQGSKKFVRAVTINFYLFFRSFNQQPLILWKYTEDFPFCIFDTLWPQRTWPHSARSFVSPVSRSTIAHREKAILIWQKLWFHIEQGCCNSKGIQIGKTFSVGHKLCKVAI